MEQLRSRSILGEMMKGSIEALTHSQRADGVAMYLELMKLSLTDSIYLNDPMAMYAFCLPPTSTESAWKWYCVGILERLLSRYKMRLVRPRRVYGIGDPSSLTKDTLAEIRRNGRDHPVRAHTMIGLSRLENLQFCVETTINEGIRGDLIETGVWRGGACIFMRSILKAYGDTTRSVWLADSFAGLPAPNANTYPADAGDTHYMRSNFLGVSRQIVEDNFRSYGLLDEQVRFLQGWFKDTLPTAPIEHLAVLRLDGDMYESTIQALDALYEKVSCGGFIIIDDYFLPNCKQAVTDFRLRNRVDDPIKDIDGMGAFWRKS